MTAPHLLDRLSELLGIQTRYTDAWGKPREAPETTRLALLAAMSFPADSDDAATRSVLDLEKRLLGSVLPPVVVTYEDDEHLEVPIMVPEGTQGRLTWILET